MKRTKLTLSLIVIMALVGHLAKAQSQDNTVVRDFNKDRSFDFLVFNMEWDDVENWDLVMTDGKTGKRYGYTSSIYYFGPQSIISIGKTRNEMPESWEPHIAKMEDSLIRALDTADPSLRWILDTEIVPEPVKSKKKSESVDLFSRVIRFKRQWHTGLPYIPENYTYRLTDEEAARLHEASPFETYYWDYRAHNHLEQSEIEEMKDLEFTENGLHNTRHALVQVDNGSYSWLFISGISTTGGPSKLRWASIRKVEEKEGLIFLQQGIVVGEYAIWVGDLQMGLWARILNSEFEAWEDFRLEEEELIILDGEGNESLKISYEELKSGLLSHSE